MSFVLGVLGLSSAVMTPQLSTGHYSDSTGLTWLDAASVNDLSWRLTAAGARLQKQRTYQLRINSTNGDAVWDSGLVSSNQTLHVPIPLNLASDSRYTAAVTVNADATNSTSFATAIAGGLWESEGAEWISGAAGVASDQASQLRAEFPVPENIAHASLYYAAVGAGKVWLNGVDVAADEALGPWTTWSERILFKCKDVTLSLRNITKAAIGVWLGGGEYNSRWTHAWCGQNEGPCKGLQKGQGPPLALRLLLRATLTNGSQVTLLKSVAGPDGPGIWQAAPSPFVSADVFAGVHFDASRLQDGFSLPQFRPKAKWVAAVATVQPNKAVPIFGPMSPHIFAPTKIVSRVRPVSVRRAAALVPKGANPDSWIFSFATNEAGWAELDTSGLPANTSVTLLHAERMTLPNGTRCLVDCDGEVSAFPWYPYGGAVDTYTVRGKSEKLGATFSYHGFQFVALSGWPKGAAPPTLSTLSQVVVHAGVERTARLHFGDKTRLLNRVYDIVVRSLLSNLHSVESDCPTRERVGWTGDAQATAETAAVSLGMLPFWSKWMQDMQDAQCNGAGLHSDRWKPGCPGNGNGAPTDLGAVSSTVPFAKHVPPVDPTWPTSYAQITWLMYTHEGDVQLLKSRFDSIRRYVDYMPTVTQCSNCHAPTRGGGGAEGTTMAPGTTDLPWYYMNGDWMAYESQALELSQTGPILASYHYVKDVEILSKMAAVVGNATLAAHYKELAENKWAEFNAVYLRRRSPAPRPMPRCGVSTEMKKGGHPLILGCSDEAGGAAVIDGVKFAAFGTPQGTCSRPQDFRHDAQCDAPGVQEKVAQLCIGKASCELVPTLDLWDQDDPCKGVVKSLAVLVSCGSASGPAVASSTAPANTSKWSYATPGQIAQQTEQVVALGTPGVVPSNARREVEQSLLQMISGAGKLSVPPTANAINTGFVGNKYVFDVVTKINASLALELAMSTALPSYGYQVTHGATTVWESWDGADDAASHNHHFMGGIGAWLHTHVAGLSQGQGIGFSHPEVSPKIVEDVSLPCASGVWQTPRGEIAVSWSLEAATSMLSLNVSLPPNTRAKVIFPCSVGAGTIVESGTVLWKDGAFVPGAVGVVAAACGGDRHVAFTVDGGGDFVFGGGCSERPQR
jgi:hypothetical protein